MSATPASAPSAASHSRQTALGLVLAGCVAGGWLTLHMLDVFLLPWRTALLLAPFTIALQCWLSVGLFIVAHDAMHGSLARFRPGVNRGIGRVVLLLYAGIWYDDLVARHFAHHRAPGTEHDPDFAGDGRLAVWRWFGSFFIEYLSVGQMVRLAGATALYVFALHVAPQRLLLFWAVPALLSAGQLFYFGTYLPHRREEEDFGDDHRARSNQFSWMLSLLTCFHFGYHHEHHSHPSVPWWSLPAMRTPSAERAEPAALPLSR